MDKISIQVAVLSGHSVMVSVESSATVMDVLRLARQALDIHISCLYYEDKTLPPTQRLNELNIQDGTALMGVARKLQLFSDFEAFVDGDAWRLSLASKDAGVFVAVLPDGQVVSWGGLACSAEFCEHLRDVLQLKSTLGAMAALKRDGSVSCWGLSARGCSKSGVRDQLQGVRALFATARSFAALRTDGAVVVWAGADGLENCGGDDSKVRGELTNVRDICSTASAFAALREDGTVVTWGNSCEGGDSSRVKGELVNVATLRATRRAFAALRRNGSVVTWGTISEGGGSFAVQDQLHDVSDIQATEAAFAALKSDGSVVSWGEAQFGGNSSEVQARLKDVVSLHANDCAFAAVLRDGSLVSWGDETGGGWSDLAQGMLRNIVDVRPFRKFFAALRADQTAICWGGRDPFAIAGVTDIRGNALGIAALKADSSVAFHSTTDVDLGFDELQDVAALHVTAGAFAAVRFDGSVVTWGTRRGGGDSRAVQDFLRATD